MGIDPPRVLTHDTAMITPEARQHPSAAATARSENIRISTASTARDSPSPVPGPKIETSRPSSTPMPSRSENIQSRTSQKHPKSVICESKLSNDNKAPRQSQSGDSFNSEGTSKGRGQEAIEASIPKPSQHRGNGINAPLTASEATSKHSNPSQRSPGDLSQTPESLDPSTSNLELQLRSSSRGSLTDRPSPILVTTYHSHLPDIIPMAPGGTPVHASKLPGVHAARLPKPIFEAIYGTTSDSAIEQSILPTVSLNLPHPETTKGIAMPPRVPKISQSVEYYTDLTGMVENTPSPIRLPNVVFYTAANSQGQTIDVSDPSTTSTDAFGSLLGKSNVEPAEPLNAFSSHVNTSITSGTVKTLTAQNTSAGFKHKETASDTLITSDALATLDQPAACEATPANGDRKTLSMTVISSDAVISVLVDGISETATASSLLAKDSMNSTIPFQCSSNASALQTNASKTCSGTGSPVLKFHSGSAKWVLGPSNISVGLCLGWVFLLFFLEILISS